MSWSPRKACPPMEPTACCRRQLWHVFQAKQFVFMRSRVVGMARCKCLK